MSGESALWREGRTLTAFTTTCWFHPCRSGLCGAGGVIAMVHRDAEVVPEVSPAFQPEGRAGIPGRVTCQHGLSLQLPATCGCRSSY